MPTDSCAPAVSTPCATHAAPSGTTRGRVLLPNPKPNPPAEAFNENRDDPDCGVRTSWPGRPKRGWVKAGTPSNHHGERWWCSWHCLSRGALVLALRGES